MKRLLPLIPCILLLVASVPAEAQVWNEVRIVRVDTTNFPSIKVHVRAFCAGQQSSNINPVTIRIYEDGQLKSMMGSLDCPNETVPVSVALALDRSGSVAGTALYRIQLGAWRFVELMQAHTTGDDEVALLSFGDDVTLDQPLTTNMTELFEAINDLYPFGVTTMYDALIAALNEVAARGTNPIKAVVVMSDGGDNNSLASLADVIALARQLGIPIFSIGLRYIDNDNELLNMKALADSTGGHFLIVDHPDDIVASFNAMMSLVTGGMNDCTFNYLSECPDGSLRELTVIAEACGVADTAHVRYYAPIDPNLPAFNISFDSSFAYERGDMLVPVSIDAEISGTVDHLQFKVLERPPLTFREVVTAGMLAAQGTVTSQRVGDTIIVDVQGPIAVSGKSTLLKLRYATPPVGKDTTFIFPVFYLDFESPDCIQKGAKNSYLTILKRPGLDVMCGDSIFVDWDETTGSYNNPLITYAVGVQNNSALYAENTRIRLHVPPGIELLSPSDSLILPTNPLPPGQTGFVEFLMRVQPSDTTRHFRICVEVQPDSGRVTTCCKMLTVEAAKTALEAECEMTDRIVWDDSLNTYVPEVFPVTVRIRNLSDLAAKNIPTWIHVPPGFAIDSTTPPLTVVSPNVLTRADTGTMTWYVRPLERPTSDLLHFCVKVAAGKDTAECCSVIYVEASPVRAQLLCSDTRVLVYDDGTGKYDPERMLLITQVKNLSKLPMTTTRGHIQLPSFLKLDAGEFPTKDFPNSAVIPPGDSAEIKWVVITTGPPHPPTRICVNITAENFPGAQCCTALDIQTVNAIPMLTCTLNGPDTIRYTSGSYVPNPGLFTVHVENTGDTPAKNLYAALLQGEDLSIDASDQSLKLLTDSLAAGKSVNGSFRVRILDRTVGRHDTIRVTVYAENGGGMVCEKVVFIEPVRGPVLQLNCDGPDSLVFVDALNMYQPSPFTIQLEARNVGTALADSVVAEFLPPPDIILATGEQAAKLLTPSSLGIGQIGTATWQLRAVPRTVSRIDTIYVQVKARGKSLQQTEPCPIAVFIPAARAAELSLTCQVVKEAGEDDTVIVAAGLVNNGTATVYDVSVQVQFPSKLTLNPGTQSLVLFADSIRPGEALRSFPWRFTIERGAVLDSVDVCFNVTARFLPPLNCCTSVRIPQADKGAFASSCTLQPDTVFVAQSSGEYEEALFRTTISNPGTVVVDSIRCSIIVPNGVVLAAGDAQVKTVRNLQPSASEDVQWRLRFVRDTATVYSVRDIRVEMVGADGLQQCEESVVVAPPPQLPSDFILACMIPDTLVYDRQLNTYDPSPFLIRAEIRNTGSATLTDIRATLTPAAEITLESGESLTKQLGVELGPGQSASIAWSCSGIPQTGTRTAVSQIRVEADGTLSRDCTPVTVLYHPPSNDSVDAQLTCVAPDTIFFRGPGQGWSPNPFSVTARISNTGTAPLAQLRLQLEFNPAFGLETGESMDKVLDEPLLPGQTASVSWVLRVLSTPVGSLSALRVRAQAPALGVRLCDMQLIVEPSQAIFTMSIPEDNVGVMGETVRVPIHMRNTYDLLFRDLTIAVHADTEFVELRGVSLQGTLFAGWPEPSTDVPEEGVLRISLAGDAVIPPEGIMLYLQCYLKPQPGSLGDLGVVMSTLRFMHHHFALEPGVSALTFDGMITSSGTCIEPLVTDTYLQLANRPNPFNPVTTISYHVPPDLDGQYGRLEVLDMHGRLVQRLVDGPLQAGNHELRFDGTGLPSGMYLYRIISGHRMVTQKMLLSK
ncbi:MAG: VWA domain-containing protein [Bacteroidetes bacterium]|nr:VWA domain-containing protein [Bacteroidota bacterium]